MNKSFRSIALAAAALAASACLNSPIATAQPAPRPGEPADSLPANITRLTWFGERAQWSPDGKRIAFMEKSFGDAFEIDLATGRIRLLTGYQHAGYLRVQYLPNGDYLLIGAPTFENIEKTRFADQEFWILKPGSKTPIRLNEKVSEGVAVSRKAMRIAWAVDWRNYPDRLPDGISAIYVADLVEKDGIYGLANKREVVRGDPKKCLSIEAQDFRDNNNQLIWTCYHRLPIRTAEIFGGDLRTGRQTIYRSVPGEYNEPEGIFPDERYILVESGRDQRLAVNTSKYLDLWKLRLGPNSQDFTRLTRFGDYNGYKAVNGVVSPDGGRIAFQEGHSGDPAGVGYGIYVMQLP